MRFLEAGLRTSLGPVRGRPVSGPDPDPGPDPGPDHGPMDPSISDLRNIHLFTVKRPYEPINPRYSINKPQMGGLGSTRYSTPQVPTQLHHPGYTPPASTLTDVHR